MVMEKMDIDKKWGTMRDILEASMRFNASDLHISVELPPIFRKDGKLIAIGQPVSKEKLKELAIELAGESRFSKIEDLRELDFSYSVPGFGRFRVNVYHQRGSLAIAARIIPFKIPSLEELNMPPILEEFTKLDRGLLIVTGPTGSGKSTTLASIIDRINNTRDSHIITLEDPIEYLHRHKQSMVNQREVGIDTPSFSSGLRSALRQDPDVILVGEMRDLETISIAVTAAETGHLVLTTLHTTDAVGTIDRVIDVFPPHQQQQIRVQLAAVLQGVVAQQLLPRVDKGGRVAAVEVLTMNPAVRNLIREQKTHQMYSVIQTSARQGMQTMDNALKELLTKRIIGSDEVQKKAVDPESILKNISLY